MLHHLAQPGDGTDAELAPRPDQVLQILHVKLAHARIDRHGLVDAFALCDVEPAEVVGDVEEHVFGTG